MNSVKDTCVYEEICVEKDQTVLHQSRLSWQNLLRQVMVCSTMWALYFMYGLHMGAPTVLIPQLRKEANSTTAIDDEMASWISSITTISAVPSALTLPVMMHKIGRKKIYIFISLSTFVGILLIYRSDSITQFLVGGFLIGALFGSHATTSPLIISEYSSTKYRGIFLTIKSASSFWGMWVSNIIGTFWHWKNIYILALFCNIYTMLSFVWPESPTWLAKEERFAECVMQHRKLKGTSKQAEKELEYLINMYKLSEENKENSTRKSLKDRTIYFFETLKNKSFYKPVFVVVLLAIQYNVMGKLICSIYAIQILQKITGDKAAAYSGMLILDGITVISAYSGCILSRFCKRRTFLFSTLIVTILILYIFSLYLFLVHRTVFKENNFVSIALLSIFSVTACCGPMILLSSIYGEIVLLKYQVLTSVIFGAVMSTTMMTSLKFSLFLFRTLTLPGTFLFFAISSSICTLLLFLYLPETKNKTVLEIEKNLMDCH